MSLGGRIQLLKAVRDLAARLEYLKAGQGESDQCEASLLERELQRVYIDWGLVKVEGITIDGLPATKQTVIDSGPEPLVKEILAAIEAQITFSEEQRKN